MMKVLDILIFHARMEGITYPGAFYGKKMWQLNLTHLLNQMYHTLSGGEQRRLGILLSIPTRHSSICFMDEPLSISESPQNISSN